MAAEFIMPKRIISGEGGLGPRLIPDLAVLDPVLTLTVPPGVTAATGIDALTHGIEAYTSRKAQPLSDTFALSAVGRIFAHLRRAYRHGDDPEARNQMALAALEAGIAFNNASVTLVHGLSRPIGTLFHVPHGVSNAMLIAPCLRFAIPGAVERFVRMAQVIGVHQPEMSDVEAALALVGAVADLCADLKIPTLKEYGVDATEFFANIDKMAEDALASGSPANTRLRPEKMDIIAIYQSLWQ